MSLKTKVMNINGLQRDKLHFAGGARAEAKYSACGSQSVQSTFVIGLPRSGSTLLANLLAGGDGVLSISEPFLSRTLYRYSLLHWLYFPKIQEFRLYPPRNCDENGFLNYLENFTCSKGFQFLIIKETYREAPVLENVRLIKRLMACNNPVVAITRHPYDAAVSTLGISRMWRGVIERLSRILVHGTPPLTDDREVVEWFARNWLSFARWCKKNHLFLLRYEDLISNPTPLLQELCEHCKIPFDRKMLDNHYPRPFGGIGDSKFRKRPPPIFARTVGRTDLLISEFRDIITKTCATAAAELGYLL